MRTGTLTSPKDTAPFHIARTARSSRRVCRRRYRQDGPMRPMLATAAEPGSAVPPGDEWAHEVKWDGMRLIADVTDGEVRLTSRTESDVTVTFPELAGLATVLADGMLDGEVVAFADG